MRCRGQVGLLVVMACAALAATSQAFTIDLRALVLTVPLPFTNTDFLETVLAGTGVPYDVVRWVNNPSASMNSTLFKAPGQPRYAAIFMYPNLDMDNTLSAQQVADLDAYRAKYNVRMVRFGAWMSYYGYTPLTVSTSGSQTLSFTAAMPFGISGIKNVPLDVNGMYRVPATLASGTPAARWCSNSYVARQCIATTLATLGAKAALGAGYGSTTIAGALVSYSNGMVEQVWAMDMAGWITNSLVFGHLTVDWAFHSMIPGMRRVLLSTQVDDVFLSTEWCTNPSKPAYRLSTTDVNVHQGFMGTINAGLPGGSSYTIDMVFNGNGVLEPVGGALDQNWDFACVDDPLYVTNGCNCAFLVQSACSSTNQWCRRCTKDWKMFPNWGANMIPATYTPAQWPALAALQGNALNSLASSNTSVLNSFIWTSHTFSHHNLHNSSTTDSYKQWYWNQLVAATMKLTTSTKYNPKGVVTPGISGLTNVNNLNQLVALGYTSAVGDNTFDFLRNVARPYWTLPLTSAVNGLETSAFRIIPRQATEIYFCASDIGDEVTQYNLLYSSFFGGPSTIAQIMTREADRVLRSTILGLRADPHMFHQANMALKTWPAGSGVTGSKSLLMVWVEQVVAAAKALTNWPIETLKQDDLLAYFLDREARDRCGLTYTLTVSDTANAAGVRSITGYTIKSAGATTSSTCKAPLLIPTAAAVTSSTAGPVTSTGAQHRLVSMAPNGQVTGTITGANW